MGRQEIPIDVGAGVAERFAAELRDLRIKAGQPTYRRLARSGHYSPATLARAASGRVFPSLEVTLAYAAACGGDADEWRQRWTEARRVYETRPAHAPAPQDATGLEPEHFTLSESNGLVTTDPAAQPVPAEASATPPGRRRRRLVLAGRVLSILSLAANIALGYAISTGSFQNDGPPPAVTARIEDGTDPRASHCDSDARTLDAQPVILHQSTRIDGQGYATGATIGTVTLRYSPHCAAAWTRFDPASNLFDNPNQGTVTVQASRPAEGAQATWRLGHVDNTYTDLLLTGMGCVQAHVILIVFDGNAAAEGSTGCLPKM